MTKSKEKQWGRDDGLVNILKVNRIPAKGQIGYARVFVCVYSLHYTRTCCRNGYRPRVILTLT